MTNTENFKKMIISSYGFSNPADYSEVESNNNLLIMIDCYIEDGGAIVGNNAIDLFAEYASDVKNLDKFISRGAVVL